MKLNENSYWAKNNFKPCWELTRCSGVLNNGDNCPAFNAGFDLPCWQVAGTRCKGKTGRDTAVCGNCVVSRRYGDGEPMSPLYNVIANPAGQIIESLDLNKVSVGRRIFRLFAFAAGIAAAGAGALAIDPALLHLAAVKPNLPVGGVLVAAGSAMILVPVLGSAKDRRMHRDIDDISRGLARVNDFSSRPPAAGKPENAQGDACPVADGAESVQPESMTMGGGETVHVAFASGPVLGTTHSGGDMTLGNVPGQPANAPVEQEDEAVSATAIEVPVQAVAEAVHEQKEEDMQKIGMDNIEETASPSIEGTPVELQVQPDMADQGHIIGQTPPGGAVVHDLDAVRQKVQSRQTSPGQPATFSDIASLFELMKQAALTDRKLAANLADEYSSVASSAAVLAENAAALAGNASKAMAAVQGVLAMAQDLSKTATELSEKAGRVSADMEEAAQLRSSLTGDAAKAAIVASKHVHAMAENLKRLVAGMGFAGEGQLPAGQSGSQSPSATGVPHHGTIGEGHTGGSGIGATGITLGSATESASFVGGQAEGQSGPESAAV